VSYGLSLAQVEQALAANNINAGGGFIERGEQALNVRAVGLMETTDDIAATVVKVQNGTPVRVRDLGQSCAGAESPAGTTGQDHSQRRWNGHRLGRRGGRHRAAAQGRGGGNHAGRAAQEDRRIERNRWHHGLLPVGVKFVPHLDRSDLMHYTTHTVLRNLTDGVLLVTLILFLFLGNVRSALIVAITIPFSLLFAAILLDLRQIPANLLSLGALDFGMVVDGSVVMVENILRHTSAGDRKSRSWRSSRRGARSAEAGVLRAHHHHRFVPSDLHFAARGGPAVQSHGLDGGVRSAGALVFALFIAPVLCSMLFSSEMKEWRNPVLEWLEPQLTGARSTGASTTSNSLWAWDWPRWRRCCSGFQRSYRFGVFAAPG
jgi:heavy metal efflux system protein